MTESNDKVVYTDDVQGVFEQDDLIVAWEVSGVPDKATVFDRAMMKKTPPVLHISDSKGGEVDFVLTKEFTESLYATLGDVRGKYYGIEKKPVYDRFRDWLHANRWTVGFLSFSLLWATVVSVMNLVG